MRQLPAGKRVGRKSLVDHAQGAAGLRIAQFLVKVVDLGRQQQPLVRDQARGHRGDVVELLLGEIRLDDFFFRPPPDHVELPLQLVLGHVGAAAQEHLLDVGLRGACGPADGVPVHRCIAPAQDRESLFLGDALDDAFADQPLLRLHRQEHHPHAVGSRFGEREAQLGAFPREKLVRDLDGDAGAVARLRVAAAGATVGQVDEDFDAFADDIVGLVTVQINDEPHPAGIVFIAGVVEPLLDHSLEYY